MGSKTPNLARLRRHCNAETDCPSRKSRSTEARRGSSAAVLRRLDHGCPVRLGLLQKQPGEALYFVA
jgi:hypothetical protein